MPLKLTTYYQGAGCRTAGHQYIPFHGAVSHLRSNSGIYSFAYCSIGRRSARSQTTCRHTKKRNVCSHPLLSSDAKYTAQENILMKPSTGKLFLVICCNASQTKLCGKPFLSSSVIWIIRYPVIKYSVRTILCR
mgnify:CR=1 FL=1